MNLAVIVAFSASKVIGPAAGALAAFTLAGSAHHLVMRPARVSTLTRQSNLGLGRPLQRPMLSRSGAAVVAVVVVGAVAVGAAAVVGPVMVAAIVGAALMLRRLGRIRAEHRRRAAIERTLPDAMDQLVLSVRAGLTPFHAVCDLAESGEAEVSDAFGEVVHRTERGQPFADALAALPQRLGNRAAGLADVLATSDRDGLPLGPMLDQLTFETRATRRRLDQAEARKLPVRLSFPLVTCTLPSFVLLAIAPAVIAALSSLGGTAW